MFLLITERFCLLPRILAHEKFRIARMFSFLACHESFSFRAHGLVVSCEPCPDLQRIYLSAIIKHQCISYIYNDELDIVHLSPPKCRFKLAVLTTHSTRPVSPSYPKNFKRVCGERYYPYQQRCSMGFLVSLLILRGGWCVDPLERSASYKLQSFCILRTPKLRRTRSGMIWPDRMQN
jgi:hypothetical protein